MVAGAVSGQAAGDEPTTVSFEERDWGYVRQDFQPPEEETAFVFTMEGYMGASSGDTFANATGDTRPTHYLRMDDGALIAIHISDNTGDEPHPLPDHFSDGTWHATASIRGTGCSGGRFSLFDRRHARDGYEIIEWLADREYSTDGVGMYGASYSGITALHVAATQPPSLACVSANMVISDVYRDIAYPGGVPNDVFPYAWTGAYRPGLSVVGAGKGVAKRDEICAQNVAGREPRSSAERIVNELTLALNETDGTEWAAMSLMPRAEQIEVPTYIAQAWQDEQTGPRGGVEMFKAIDPDPVRGPEDVPGRGPPPGVGSKGQGKGLESPKWLRTTNGYHTTAGSVAGADQARWFDFWLRGEDNGIDQEPAVELNLETVSTNEGPDPNASLGFDAFPPRTAEWTDLHLRAGGSLSTDPPGDEPADTYATGSPRHSWVFGSDGAGGEATLQNGPDVLTYRSEPFETPMLLAGPTTATLFVESTATEMDLFVRLAAEYADGSIVPLQRGLLRASHRGLNPDRTRYDDDGDVTRPYHYHTHPEPISPGEVYEYNVEVWPVAHPFRPGDRLIARIHSPPVTDGLWGYEPAGETGLNTVYHDENRPSRLNVPLVPVDGLPAARPCDAPEGYRCYDGYGPYPDVGPT